MEFAQGPLERIVLQGQAVAAPGSETPQGVSGGQAKGQRRVDLGLLVGRARQVFGLEHFALAPLRIDVQQGAGEHVDQPCQTGAKVLRRHLEEIVGGPAPGAGVDLAAAHLQPRHQALVAGKRRATEKRQVLEEVGQAGMRARLVVAARRHPQPGSGARCRRIMRQVQAQAVGQHAGAASGVVLGVAIHGRPRGFRG